MHELGKYHARGIHTWNNGFCSFHAQNVCQNVGKCGDEELKCKGKPYKSKNIVTCPLPALAYAAQVIHSELGKEHSNLCESAFSVLPKFRAKNLAFHRLTYMSDMKARATILTKKKSAAVKKKYIELKTAHIEEQEESKQWAKRQKILHQYGEEDSDDSSENGGSETPPAITGQELVDDAMLVLCEVNEETSKKGKGKAKRAQKPCKCGSTTHSRTSFGDCPLHK